MDPTLHVVTALLQSKSRTKHSLSAESRELGQELMFILSSVQKSSSSSQKGLEGLLADLQHYKKLRTELITFSTISVLMGSTFLRSAAGQVKEPCIHLSLLQPWAKPDLSGDHLPEAAELIQKEKAITQKQVHTNKRLTSGRDKDSADICGSKPSQACLSMWPWGDAPPQTGQQLLRTRTYSPFQNSHTQPRNAVCLLLSIQVNISH